MARKTDEQKAFEKFVICELRQEELFKGWNARFFTGSYINDNINFGFKCWQESARIQKEHYRG
jgi:serine protease inhibitor ecotin